MLLSDGLALWLGTARGSATAEDIRVAAVDTTGAGGIFYAGIVYGVLKGWPPLSLVARPLR